MKNTYWPFTKYQKIIPLRPSTLGVVQRESVRCGKRNCACVNGKPHHGYYHYFRDPLSKLRYKRYIPRYAVCKLKQRLRYWKNKYYFWNYMPAKTLVYAGILIDQKRMSSYYKRLHILTQIAKNNFFESIKNMDQKILLYCDSEFSGEPYRYLLCEKGTPAPNYLQLLLKSVKNRLQCTDAI